jgi:uncharacterized membrane protein
VLKNRVDVHIVEEAEEAESLYDRLGVVIKIFWLILGILMLYLNMNMHCTQAIEEQTTTENC